MAREFAKWFYDSSAWRKCRASYISKRQGIDGGMCERCRERPGYIVHHKTAITPCLLYTSIFWWVNLLLLIGMEEKDAESI